MSSRANLINQEFGKLTVIQEEIGQFKIKKRATWMCKCECGRIVYLPTNRLTVAKQVSCGFKTCVDKKKPQQDLVGQRFGKLVVLAPEFGTNRKKIFTWKCQCDCKNHTITYVATNTLKSGHTKSCGCGELENKHNNCAKFRIERTKNRQDPRISLSKWVFDERYSDGDLTFDDFYILSQENCFYCNSPPSNDLKFSSRSWTQEYRDASRFIYNGLDRKDPTQLHTKENCVPCCWVCNSGKRHFTFEVFTDMVRRIHLTTIAIREELSLPTEDQIVQFLLDRGIFRPNNHQSKSGKTIVSTLKGRILEKRFYGRYAKDKKHGYNDGDLTFMQFAYLALQPCYYCREVASNRAKYLNVDNEVEYVSFNGLDRKDCNQKHILDNVVPCCKHCNYAKRTQSHSEFLDWASRVYHNLVAKQIIQ